MPTVTTLPKGTCLFCPSCRLVLEGQRCCMGPLMLIDKDAIKRDAQGRIVDVQESTSIGGKR